MDCHRLVLYSEVNSDGEKSEKSHLKSLITRRKTVWMLR